VTCEALSLVLNIKFNDRASHVTFLVLANRLGNSESRLAPPLGGVLIDVCSVPHGLPGRPYLYRVVQDNPWGTLADLASLTGWPLPPPTGGGRRQPVRDAGGFSLPHGLTPPPPLRGEGGALTGPTQFRAPPPPLAGRVCPVRDANPWGRRPPLWDLRSGTSALGPPLWDLRSGTSALRPVRGT